MTPNERHTLEYFDILMEEDKSFKNENKKEIFIAITALVQLYGGMSSRFARKFKFDNKSYKIFRDLINNIESNFTIYMDNAARISRFKNEKILSEKLLTPSTKSWINRIIDKININSRIKKYIDLLILEIEAQMAIGISNKYSKIQLIKSISNNIADPYSIINSVKDNNWKSLLLTKKYNYGSGTYKSALANLNRLSSDTLISSFRRADYVIWKNSSMVTGIRVYLNPAHPSHDICDEMIGLYPKEYFFTGFHIKCICYAEPIILGNQVNDIPLNSKLFMSDEKHLKWYSGLPFYTENKKFFN